jgi:hypothetical protein
MRFIFLIALGLFFVHAQPSQSSATSIVLPQIGEWVLGNFQSRGYWYSRVVARADVNGVTIKYDDGDVETVPYERLRPYNWGVGSRVECNFQNSGQWYKGTIQQLGGTALSINYDDGDFERTRTGLCRSQ